MSEIDETMNDELYAKVCGDHLVPQEDKQSTENRQSIGQELRELSDNLTTASSMCTRVEKQEWVEERLQDTAESLLQIAHIIERREIEKQNAMSMLQIALASLE